MDRRRAVKEANKVSLLHAAENVLQESGYRALSPDTIAERAGVSRRTFFNHFSSVDDALYTILTNYFKVFAEEFHPRSFDEPVGGEIEIVRQVRLVCSPENIAQFVYPSLSIVEPIIRTGKGKGLNIWFGRAISDMTDLFNQRIKEVYPQMRPAHAQITINAAVGAFMAGVNEWIEWSLKYRDGATPALPEEELYRLIDNNFQYLERLLSGILY